MQRERVRTKSMQKIQIDVLYDYSPVEGRVEVAHGSLAGLAIIEGDGLVEGNGFMAPSPGACRLRLEFGETRLDPGGKATRVTLRTSRPFSFFLRDVSRAYPIYLPQYGAAVVPAGDLRSYQEIAAEVRDWGRKNVLETIASEPEENYEAAAQRVKRMQCQTWLGISRDMRLFEVAPHFDAGYWGWVQPRLHATPITSPDGGSQLSLRYEFALGRGSGCQVDVSRRLHAGSLPVLEGESRDGDIAYRLQAFVSYESTSLEPGTLQGTPALLAYGHGHGNHIEQEPEQKKAFQSLLEEFQGRSEETVLYLRAEAQNEGPAPAYAWFAAPRLYPWYSGIETRYDGEQGFCLCGQDQVYSLVRLNGQAMPDFEAAVLLPPGAKAIFEFAIPHQPLPRWRARRLAGWDFDARLAECIRFWNGKLASAARIQLPEKRVNEMFQAGLLHLDLVTYGKEPDGPAAACVGVYTPIGLESAPIVLFLDSMGWHDLARRAIEFFLEMQRDDGFIQVFSDYMLETGGVLYMIGEHYRFTHDLDWIRRIAPKALRSVQYLLQWRERNCREDLRGRGYGMLEGKVADPKDPQRYFMNSGLACAGLQRAAEWLAEIDPQEAGQLREQAESFRQDIRLALEECIARSPAIPRRDGTWIPSAPPWAEGTGPSALYCEGEPTFTHHTVTARDSLLGPLWLVYTGVVEPGEPLAEILVQSHAEMATVQNVPFSQPYYSRSDYAHLRRGEMKAFLMRYYHNFASLADRETYTFWEHYFGASPHKTHEEAWFLMQTRWMLALEEGEALRLLAGIPRAWLRHGQRVAFENLVTYFGPVSLEVHSNTDEGMIEATYACCPGREPARLLLRLPHPEGYKAVRVEGGAYEAESETVEIHNPGKGLIRLFFTPRD